MFTIEFHTRNAAFDENPKAAIRKVVLDVLKKLDEVEPDPDLISDGYVYDGNGNKIGDWLVTWREDEHQ